MKFACVLHGSFGKHFEEIKRVHRIFSEAGIEVLAPAMSEIVGSKDGFALLESDTEADPRLIELIYLHNLKKLGISGFSYFVNPEGYIGKSASYELGIAQAANVPCFFMQPLSDHPAYLHANSVWAPELLAEYIQLLEKLPDPRILPDERKIHRLWEGLTAPGSVVAVGGIIELDSLNAEKEVLLVKTHKWGGRYSMVGGKVRRSERLADALAREVAEETGLRSRLGKHLCTFDEIKDSGYYQRGMQHIFVDHVVSVESRLVTLNDEAQEYVWIPAREALAQLDIEPNARHTLELYTQAI